MKKNSILLFFLFCVSLGYGQAIVPTENEEVCPHPDYKNAQLGHASVVRFEVDLPGPAADYTVAVDPSPVKPIGCRVIQNLPGGTQSKVQFYIAFEDQRAVIPQFTISKISNGAILKTYKFPLIRSIKGLQPGLIFTSPVDVNLCTTPLVIYSFQYQVRYRKISDGTEYGGGMPLYEYSVPKGWKVGNQTSAGPNNYILASPGADIRIDEIHNGEVKIRATQNSYLCSFGTQQLAPGEWATIPAVNRPQLRLSTGGNTSLNLNCGVSSTHTFTVENGVSNGCISYEWNLGTAAGNWLYNGSPAPQIITTTTNSITLTAVGCSVSPTSVAVALKVNNAIAETFSLPVTVTVTPATMSGSTLACSSEVYSVNNLICGSNVQWTSSSSTIATITSNGAVATLTRNGNNAGEVIITATISGGCNNGAVLEKKVWFGPPLRPKAFDEQGQEIRNIIGCTMLHVNMSVYNDAPVEDYVWTKVSGDYNMYASGNSASFIAFLPATGLAEVKAINSCGESLRTKYMVSFTNCSGGLNAVDDANASEVKIHPNPVNGVLKATVKEKANGQSGTARLFNLQGQLLRDGQIRNGQVTFDTGKLPDGIYILHITTQNGTIRKQVIVRH